MTNHKHGKLVHPNPKKAMPVPHRFVASGTAEKDFDCVVGYLTDNANQATKFIGRPIRRMVRPTAHPTQHQWAVDFAHTPVPIGPTYTLEIWGVIGMAGGLSFQLIDIHEAVTVKALRAKVKKGEFAAPTIEWPADSETGICASCFVPYGTYDGTASATLTVTLTLGSDSTQLQQASVVSPVAEDGIWSAQFDPIPSAGPYNLKVTESTGGSAPANNLGFDTNC